MKFVIHQLKIWFGKDIKPRVLDFVPNKVNVITGDSGTGKSNIVAIIDYCLLSRKSNIVEQVINENAMWYSIFITINNHKLFLGRRKENLGQDSSSICLIKDNYNDEYPEENITIKDAVARLNELSGVTNTHPFPRKNGVYPLEVSFRTNLIFNYLTERIISLDNIYFDFDFFERSLMGDHKSHIMDKALGLNNSSLESKTKELKDLETGYEKFIDSHRLAKNKNKIFEQTLDNLISKAIEAGIISQKIYFGTDEKVNVLIDIAESYKKVALGGRHSDKINELTTKKRRLELEFRQIEKTETEFIDYEKNLNSFKDVLQPIEIIKSQNCEIVRSFETQQLIAALTFSLQQLKDVNFKKTIQPVVSQADIKRIKNEINRLGDEITKINKTSSSIPTNDYFAFVTAIEIKAELQRAQEKKGKTSHLQPEYDSDYVQKCMDLKDKIKKEERAKPALNSSINRSLQIFYNRLNSMANYSNCEINYNMEDYIVQLKQPGTGFPYGKIGSKSNDMFLHLCCFLGIHKYVLDNNTQSIYPFIFVDQPSIPYYSGSDSEKTEDKTMLLDAFQLLNDFISLYGSEFQIILVEHAPESYWKELDNFHTVETFTKNNKLIPRYITDQK